MWESPCFISPILQTVFALKALCEIITSFQMVEKEDVYIWALTERALFKKKKISGHPDLRVAVPIQG